ncbi:hypothetical protein JOC33_001875 [Thalassobacillus pellis]|nr:hypothetical protein [Thalassobacillus pellis]
MTKNVTAKLVLSLSGVNRRLRFCFIQLQRLPPRGLKPILSVTKNVTARLGLSLSGVDRRLRFCLIP